MIVAAAIGAGGIAALAGGAWAVLRRRRPPARIASAEDAASAAERALPGFRVAGAVVGADGAGALAVSTDGRVAAIAPGPSVAEVPWRALRATAEGVVVESEGRGPGAVSLDGVDVLDIRRLAQEASG